MRSISLQTMGPNSQISFLKEMFVWCYMHFIYYINKLIAPKVDINQ